MAKGIKARLARIRERLWRLKCRRNRPWPLERAPRAPASYRARGGVADLAGRRPALCVVLHTHARPQACSRLLEDLHGSLAAAGRSDAFVLVLNDPSEADYTPVLARLAERFAGRFAFHEASARLGKSGYWFVYQHSFDVLAALGATHALFLQDDLGFERGFIADAWALWQRIEDPAKAVLSLISLADDEPQGRWVRFPRRPDAGGDWSLTQWFDLQAFIAGPRFFETVRWQVYPAPGSRWTQDPRRSSGVGEHFTRRLFGRCNVYQVARTLVFHGGEPSLMNPEARAARALDNRPAVQG